MASAWVRLGGERVTQPVPASCRFAMEPSCPLLLAGFSLPLAKALTANTTGTAESNWTATTSGKGLPLSPVPRARLPRSSLTSSQGPRGRREEQGVVPCA